MDTNKHAFVKAVQYQRSLPFDQGWWHLIVREFKACMRLVKSRPDKYRVEWHGELEQFLFYEFVSGDAGHLGYWDLLTPPRHKYKTMREFMS